MSTELENAANTASHADMAAEVAEWIEAFDDVIAADWQHSAELLAALRRRAQEAGVATPTELVTPYRNTIPQARRGSLPR